MPSCTASCAMARAACGVDEQMRFLVGQGHRSIGLANDHDVAVHQDHVPFGVAGRMMAEVFEFATAGRIVFGLGMSERLPEVLAALGSRPFVLTRANTKSLTGLIEGLPGSISTQAVSGEPTVQVCRDALDAAKAHDADVVVGLGGGSVIDVAKAVGILLTNEGDPLKYLEVVGEGQPLTRPGVPVVAVPTTAGTGSEVTANSVLTSPDHGVKASLRHPNMLPRVAVVDPSLTLDCPPSVTAASGLDALTQCLEPLVSSQANIFTDMICREGLRRGARGLRRAYDDGSDVSARTDMAVCSLHGGLALANAKLGAVHGFAGPLGGMTGAAHGRLCAALLAPVMQTNIEVMQGRDPGNPALATYGDVARILTGDNDATVADGLAWLREIVEALDVPGLEELGLSRADVPAAVKAGQAASSMKGNPVTLTVEELTLVLDRAM